jgi:hypothetical protein
MADRDLVADADELAEHLGLSTPVTDMVKRQILTSAIRFCQVRVESYLGRLVTPYQYRETGRRKAYDGSYNLTRQPVWRVVSATQEIDPDTDRRLDTYTVVYLAGLDAANDPELEQIKTFVLDDASWRPQVRKLSDLPEAGRITTSLSAEGQSVAYTKDHPTVNEPGYPPDLTMLDQWRIRGRTVFQRAGPSPYPYQDQTPFGGFGGWGRW